MDSHTRKDKALELLSRAERELVSEIFRRCAPSARFEEDSIDENDDEVFKSVAHLRIRNIVQKHSEALKRARLAAARTGRSDDRVERIELQLWICSEALAVCNRPVDPAEDIQRSGDPA